MPSLVSERSRRRFDRRATVRALVLGFSACAVLVACALTPAAALANTYNGLLSSNASVNVPAFTNLCAGCVYKDESWTAPDGVQFGGFGYTSGSFWVQNFDTTGGISAGFQGSGGSAPTDLNFPWTTDCSVSEDDSPRTWINNGARVTSSTKGPYASTNGYCGPTGGNTGGWNYDDLVEHLQNARGGASVQRAGERADGSREGGGDVRAGRGDHARGEGRRAHAMLSGRRPVGVDRARVARVRFAAPAGQEALGDRLRGVDLALRDRRPAEPARRLGDERERHHRGERKVVTGLGIGDVEHGSEPPLRAERGQGGLHVGARVAGMEAERVGRGGLQAGKQAVIDEQAPDLFEWHLADQLLDVDPAVAQRVTIAVGLGDLGREGNDPFEA